MKQLKDSELVLILHGVKEQRVPLERAAELLLRWDKKRYERAITACLKLGFIAPETARGKH